jgi:hypothetical protein
MFRQVFAAISLAIALGVPLTGAHAGEADVLKVDAIHSGNGVWQFTVTVQHADEGWEHYANRFDVLSPDGTVLGVRTLYHTHVDEQPFTRSLGGVAVPEGIDKVIVRAGDSVHDYGGIEVEVALER